MGKLIDTDELMEWVSDWFEWNGCWSLYSNSNDIPIIELKHILDQIDGLEVEPIKHGYWKIFNYEEPRRYECSNCKRVSYDWTIYCPHCGTKMDGKEIE